MNALVSSRLFIWCTFLRQAGSCGLRDIKFSSTNNGLKGEYIGNCTRPSARFPDYPEQYIAAQFHIHTSCEHFIDGKGCDAELHIVHFSADTDLNDFSTYKAAVVGMMISKDALAPHPAMEDLLDCWSADRKKFTQICNPNICEFSTEFVEPNVVCKDSAFDIYSAIPQGSGYYNYMGSLTTPPCSQIVRWNLMDKKVSISLKQWAVLANLVLKYGGFIDGQGVCKYEETVASKTGSTSRLPQGINGRTVSHRCNAIA